MSDSGLYFRGSFAGQLTHHFCHGRFTGNTQVWRNVGIQYHGFRVGQTSGITAGAALPFGQYILNQVDQWVYFNGKLFIRKRENKTKYYSRKQHYYQNH
ncbi:MAG: hypothetical protein A4E52_01207 [Pelotomaculum sp. PtaB.Bin013]|nr:MAG: hypothetical protein A4E52_01207 [Pelotomaculum sp. PtaB.Bin013]